MIVKVRLTPYIPALKDGALRLYFGRRPHTTYLPDTFIAIENQFSISTKGKTILKQYIT